MADGRPTTLDYSRRPSPAPRRLNTMRVVVPFAAGAAGFIAATAGVDVIRRGAGPDGVLCVIAAIPWGVAAGLLVGLKSWGWVARRWWAAVLVARPWWAAMAAGAADVWVLYGITQFAFDGRYSSRGPSDGEWQLIVIGATALVHLAWAVALTRPVGLGEH